jgi:hypothetical protein
MGRVAQNKRDPAPLSRDSIGGTSRAITSRWPAGSRGADFAMLTMK